MSSSRGFERCSLHVLPLLEKSGSGVVMVSAGSRRACSTAGIYRVFHRLTLTTVAHSLGLGTEKPFLSPKARGCAVAVAAAGELQRMPRNGQVLRENPPSAAGSACWGDTAGPRSCPRRSARAVCGHWPLRGLRELGESCQPPSVSPISLGKVLRPCRWCGLMRGEICRRISTGLGDVRAQRPGAAAELSARHLHPHGDTGRGKGRVHIAGQ